MKRSGNHFPIRGAIAGVIVVLGAAVAAWWLLSDGGALRTTRPAEEKRGLIREATPAKAATNAAPKKVDNRPRTLSGCPIEQCYRDEQGVLRYPGGLRARTEPPARRITVGSGKPNIFNHSAERDIAGVLQLEPGDLVVGSLHTGPRFLESFKKSLTEPTLVLQTDDEETKQLKRDVNVTKAELKARMDAGVDPGKILSDARDELQAMKRDPNVTVEDYKDYVRAANTMLEKKGIRKFSMPGAMLERALRRQKNPITTKGTK